MAGKVLRPEGGKSVKDYECAVILVPNLGTDGLQAATKKYSEIITSNGGSLTEIDEWGKRSLAYEINYHREGYYYFYKFRGTNEVLSELNRQMRIDENVIRHMIVRDEYKVTAQPAAAASEETNPEE